MKKYSVQIVRNDAWGCSLDALKVLLAKGYEIERADSTNEMIVYILSKEEE